MISPAHVVSPNMFPSEKDANERLINRSLFTISCCAAFVVSQVSLQTHPRHFFQSQKAPGLPPASMVASDLLGGAKPQLDGSSLRDGSRILDTKI